jgi:hypothetical protein
MNEASMSFDQGEPERRARTTGHESQLEAQNYRD